MADFETIQGAAYWASYLINGDDSGINEDERALADAWCERNGVADVVDFGEPHFSWYYGLHTGADCRGGDLVDYVVRLAENDAEAR